MTVKELKEFIAELPDHCVVVIQVDHRVEVVHEANADFGSLCGDSVKTWNKQHPVITEDDYTYCLSGPNVVLISR